MADLMKGLLLDNVLNDPTVQKAMMKFLTRGATKLKKQLDNMSSLMAVIGSEQLSTGQLPNGGLPNGELPNGQLVNGHVRKAQAAKPKKTKKVVRAKNTVSLHQTVSDLLKVPMTTAEIAEAVKKTGYKSSSKDFKNVVYQALYQNKAFQHKDGKWTKRPVRQRAKNKKTAAATT